MDAPSLPAAANTSDVLRVVGTCGFGYWHDAPNGTGTDFHGPFLWTLQEMKTRYN